MIRPVLTLPEPARVGFVKEELNNLVATIDAARTEKLEPGYDGFSFLGHFSNGLSEDLRLTYDFGKVESHLLGILRSLVRPLLVPIEQHERKYSQNGAAYEVVEGTRRTVSPNLIPSLGWHSGDPDRYLLSNFSTDILVGELEVPDYYTPRRIHQSATEANAMERRGIAGEVISQIIQATGELPPGLDIIKPEPGEIVRIDKTHVHRMPINMTDAPIDRIFMRIDPRNF